VPPSTTTSPASPLPPAFPERRLASPEAPPVDVPEATVTNPDAPVESPEESSTEPELDDAPEASPLPKDAAPEFVEAAVCVELFHAPALDDVNSGAVTLVAQLAVVAASDAHDTLVVDVSALQATAPEADTDAHDTLVVDVSALAAIVPEADTDAHDTLVVDVSALAAIVPEADTDAHDTLVVDVSALAAIVPEAVRCTNKLVPPKFADPAPLRRTIRSAIARCVASSMASTAG
jgi:hypothetical protein